MKDFALSVDWLKYSNRRVLAPGLLEGLVTCRISASNKWMVDARCKVYQLVAILSSSAGYRHVGI